MSIKPEVLEALKNYHIATLDGKFPVIKFGHIHNILQTFPRGSTEQAPLLPKFLNNNWRIDVELCEFQKVLEQFKNLNKNGSRKSGMLKLIAHYNEVFFMVLALVIKLRLILITLFRLLRSEVQTLRLSNSQLQHRACFLKKTESK